MPRRQFVVAFAIVLALLLPATALAQIGSSFGDTYSLSAVLSGANEVPPADPDGFGYARITIFLETGQVCFQLSVARIEPATAAHIHVGPAGVNGPVVVPLETPVGGLSSGCAEADTVLLAEILAEPWNYYVNVHNADYPGGAVRGQLEGEGRQAPPPPPAEPDIEVVASGLNNPRGIDFGADGSAYVALAGQGGDDCVTLGEGEDATEVCTGVSGQIAHVMDGHTMPALSGLPSMTAGMDVAGPHDVVVDGDTIYAVVGFGFALTVEIRDGFGEDAAAFGTLVASTGDGGFEIVADLLAYETANNPDGGAIDSNPFSLVMVEDGFVVSDAGANALLHVTMDGTVSTLAVFPSTMVEAPPFLGAPPGTMIPMEAVPTGVTVGPDGAYYVGQLTGFPFVQGAANVWRVMDEDGDGDALEEGEVTVYAAGFTNIIDVAFDGAGNLYVLEMLVGGLLNANPEDPSTLTAGLTMVAPDGTQTEIPTTGLIFATGLGIAADGTIYVSNLGVMGPQGQIVRLSHTAVAQP